MRKAVATLGLSMIVRNEARNLRACLESVAGVVSQIVVADTGSTDNTPSLARELGAAVISVPWNSDFAGARNAALERMETDWVLFLDADEELDAAARNKIPGLLARHGVGGYLVPIHNYVPASTGRGWDRATQPNDSQHPRAKNAPAYFVHENCRLFRRAPEVRFSGRVHELVEPSIKAAGLDLRNANFFIHHFGQLSEEETRKRKAAGYLELLRLKVQESPGDAMAWLQLGLQEYECSHQAEEPLRCFDRALQLEPRAAQGWLFKGMILLDLGNYQAALAALQNAASDSRSGAFCEHLRGDALHNLGRLEEARQAYARALHLTRGDPVLSSKLGYTEVRLGLVKAGTERLRRASQAAPGVGEIQERLMKAYIAAGNVMAAGQPAEALARIEGTAKSYLRAASVWMHGQQKQRAQAVLNQALILFPNSAELQRASGELAAAPMESSARAGAS
jgi:glycosyltransferase involved in cell wall biosynthesis